MLALAGHGVDRLFQLSGETEQLLTQEVDIGHGAFFTPKYTCSVIWFIVMALFYHNTGSIHHYVYLVGKKRADPASNRDRL